MNTVEGHISFKEIEFPSINRKITLSELNEFMKHAFPIIYDSMRRGRGLALGIIKYLYEHGEASMYMLKRELNVEFPAVRKILVRMEEKGYVTHRTEKGRGPKGKYVYSLTPLGGIVYCTILLHKPYSWIIDDYLKNGKDVFIVNFLKENEEILKNKVLEELFNYLFIKYTKIDFEDIYREAKAFFYPTTPIILSILSSIASIVINYLSVEIIKTLEPSYRGLYAFSMGYLSFPTLFPIEEEKKEFYKDVISILGDLLGKKTLSLSEIIRLTISYLKDIVLQAQRVSLYHTFSLMLELKREIDKDAKLDELYKKLDIIGDTILEIIETI